jgi:polysaccharide export outer membrane protein
MKHPIPAALAPLATVATLAALAALAACGGGAAPHGPPPTFDPTLVPRGAAFAPPDLALPLPGVLPPGREPTLIPGDLVAVRVYKSPDLDLEVRIPHEGSISYPLIGSVRAAGLTPGQLERTLAERLGQEYLKDPHVTVTVRDYAPRRVYILGGVLKPDGYPLGPASRITLLQLVSAAGGFSDRAYKEHVSIVRVNGEGSREVIRLSIVDVEREVAKGNAAADLELYAEDLVVIPSAARVVYVLGAVKSPGSFDMANDSRITVSMAVSRAGSYTKFAATGRIQVLRQTPDGKSTRIPVNLDRIVEGSLDEDIELRPGDVVWVPERGLF